MNIDNSESLEDVDHSVIYFNQAVILYHLRQYKAALNILDRLFQYIEPLGNISILNNAFTVHQFWITTVFIIVDHLDSKCFNILRKYLKIITWTLYQ